ncbi:MAG: DsbA family protein [Chloroflexi bacterium]|nr:DsbA family protein [Chloroflexota bacterium]
MSNREEIKRKKKKQQKRKDLTPIIIVGTLAVVIVIIVILTQFKPVGDITIPETQKASITNGLMMGDPNAKVQIVEFADFQCPGCGYYWANMEPEIKTQYIETGKANLTYSPFSFLGDRAADQSWNESNKSTEAVYCANDQDKFWEYRDFLFANQNGENQGAFSQVRLLAFGKEINLDSKIFKDCLVSGKYAQGVIDANLYATEQSVNQTPSFLVNGKLVTADILIQTIEEALIQ